MRKTLIILSNLIILSLASQPVYSSTAQLKEFGELVKESQAAPDPFEHIDKESRSLKVDAKKNMYLTAGDTLKALTLLKNYPLPPKSTLKAYEIMEGGLADSLPTLPDKREFLEFKYNLRWGKIAPYLSLGRRLVNSTAYLSPDQKSELSKTILDQAKKNLEVSKTLIEVMTHLVIINDAIKLGLLKTNASSAKGLDDLRLEGRNLSATLNDEAKKLDVMYLTAEKIKNLPDKTVEGLARLTTNEFKGTKDLRTRVNTLLKNVSVL